MWSYCSDDGLNVRRSAHALAHGAGTCEAKTSTSKSTSAGVLEYQHDREVLVFAGATAEIRTPGLRFTKPLQAASQCTGASVFARLKSIDSEIETLRQERQSLIARLETFVRGEGEE